MRHSKKDCSTKHAMEQQWQISGRLIHVNISRHPHQFVPFLLDKQTQQKVWGAKNGYLRSATAVPIKLPPSVLLFSSTPQSRKQPPKKNRTDFYRFVCYSFLSRKQPENITGTRTVWADCKLPVSYHLVTVCLQKLWFFSRLLFFITVAKYVGLICYKLGL